MLSGIVLTKNSQASLSNCLSSLAFCDEIIVVDDNSTDNTLSLAKKAGAKVLSHPLNGDFSAQRNFALGQARQPWVLFLDSDEVISDKLATDIPRLIQDTSVKGYLIRRVDTLWGRQIHHGDAGNTYLLRLGRRTAGLWQGRVHETWQISGNVKLLKSPILHYPHATVSQYLASINQYSSLRAAELYANKYSAGIGSVIFYPIGKFIYLYILKLGFLDQTPGFIGSMIMSFYSFLVRGKLFLLSKGIRSENE